MKTMLGIVMATVGLSSTAVFAADTWGVAELKTAQDAALDSFKDKNGEALYAAISGFSVERSAQGTSGRAKVSYKDNGVSKTATFFCHVHEGTEIDCH